MAESDKKCVKKNLTPWLICLVALMVIAFVCLYLGVGTDEITEVNVFQAVPSARAGIPGGAAAPRAYSYHHIVEKIRPAVVGIRLPGARPFLNAWPNPDFGAKRTMRGPYSQPGAAQPQMWRPHLPEFEGQALARRAPAAPQTAPAPARRTEYLECPNCRVRIKPTPGIPRSGAVCPNCKTPMVHVIRERAAAPLGNAASLRRWGAAGQPMHNPFNIQDPSERPDLRPRAHASGAARPQAQTMPPSQNMQQTLGGIGAGIVISKRGYILTSAHLLQGRSEAEVILFTPQGKETLVGVVEDVFPELDLAVLRIRVRPPIELAVASLGDSSMIRVGDTVLAFGNPFGLTQTVTSGIISAKRQNIKIEGQRLSDLIQTDAPINQGNAGGPLVNMRGEVIGINTAIYSPMQTHTGLGFAVPIDSAKKVAVKYIDPPAKAVPAGMSYIEYAKPKAYPAAAQAPPEEAPAWIGVEFQILNDVLAEQFKTPFDRGLVVSRVYPGSPAETGGFQRGDVIYRANGRRITDETKVRTFLADKKPGDTVKFSVFRAGKKVRLKVTLAGGSMQKLAAKVPPPPDGLLAGAEIEVGTADLTALGLTVNKITPEVAFAFGLPEDTTGVLIAGVEGLAMRKGVKEGDIIVSVDAVATPDLLSLFKALKKRDLVRGADLGLMRKGRELHVLMKESPASTPRGV